MAIDEVEATRRFGDASIWPEACAHTAEIEIRRRRIRGGRIQYWKQCMTCGDSVGTAISHEAVHREQGTIEIPFFDESIADRYNDLIMKEVNKHKEDLAEEYKEYLKTEKWSIIRNKVLKRDNYICQGCLDSPAEQVHHKSYNHMYDEFCFELVSICRKCHQRFHEIDQNPSGFLDL